MLQTKRGIAWLLSAAMLFGMLSYGCLPAMAEELPIEQVIRAAEFSPARITCSMTAIGKSLPA